MQCRGEICLFGLCGVEFENVCDFGNGDIRFRVAVLDDSSHSCYLEAVDNDVKHGLGRF